MKRLVHKLAVACVLSAAAAALTACGPQTPAVQQKMLIAGSFWDTIAVVNRSAGDVIEWKYGLPEGSECNSVEIVPGSGDVLLSYKKGARVVKRDAAGTLVWDFTDVAPDEELQTAVCLGDSAFLLAIAGSPARIVELDSTGKNIIREVRYDLGIKPAHAQFRRVAKAMNGNYLIPIISNGQVLEIKDDTTLVMTYNVGGNPFSVQELPNGNLFMGLGDAHCALEIDRVSGSLVQKLDSIAGVPLHFVAQSTRLEEGGALIANWQGHIPAEKQVDAQLVQLDTVGQVVWKYDGRQGRPLRGGGVDFISAFYPFVE